MKVDWCKLPRHEFIALSLIGGIDCNKCVHRCCVQYGQTTFVTLNNCQQFDVHKINNKLPSHNVFCSKCRKNSGIISEIGTIGMFKRDNTHLLICCSHCRERWTMKISQYEAKFKRKILI